MKALFYAAIARAIDLSKDQSFVFRSGVFGNALSVQGRESVEKVAGILNVEPNTEANFTKGAFTAGLTQDVDLLHYHAHATTQSNEPLEQSLEFSDGPLSVQDILDIVPKTRSYHATILGCSSGVTVKTANDPLGLVPALMYNGAASIVSALWPIDDHDAALFANEFYSEFLQHHGDGQQGNAPGSPSSDQDTQRRTINLALATQKAVLGILNSSQDGATDLKHWAGFVLNGWWMLNAVEKNGRKGPPGPEKFPEMQSAKPWPPPPPAPPVRVRSWLMMVPRWFSFYTLWPYFEW